MKHTYFSKFLMVLFTLTGVFAYGQFTVTFGSTVYVNNQPVSQGSPISIGTNNSVSVKFDVDITTNNPPSSSQPGEITLWYKKNASAFPVSIITQGGVVFNGNQTTRPFVIDLYASNFDPTGGVVYAEFKSFSGLIYKGGNWSVTRQDVPDITNNVIAGEQTIFYGQVASLIGGNTPSGGTGTFSYLWDKKIGTGNWERLTATAQSLSPGALTVTTQFRRHALSANKGTVSNTVTVTVINSPSITNNVISASQSIPDGSAPAALIGSVPSGGNGAGSYRYEWFEKKLNGSTLKITGATAKDYAPGILLATTEYYRVVYSGNAVSTSPNVVITVINYPAISNNTISFNGTAIIGSTPLGGNDLYTYEWTMWSDVVEPTLIAGASAKDYTPLAWMISATPQMYFMRTVRSVNKISSSNQENLSAPIQNNTITLSGMQITGSLPTGGTGSYTYQWFAYESYEGEVIGEVYQVPGTGQHFTITSIGGLDRSYYRVVKSGVKTSGSNVVTYSVAGRPAAKAAIATEASKGAGISVYPNPVAEVVHFALGNEIQKNMVISVYSDFSGQELPVYSGNIAPGQIVTWNIPAQCARGLYFYKIVCGNDVTTGKLLLR